MDGAAGQIVLSPSWDVCYIVLIWDNEGKGRLNYTDIPLLIELNNSNIVLKLGLQMSFSRQTFCVSASKYKISWDVFQKLKVLIWICHVDSIIVFIPA